MPSSGCLLCENLRTSMDEWQLRPVILCVSSNHQPVIFSVSQLLVWFMKYQKNYKFLKLNITSVRALSHLPHLIWSFGLYSLIWTKVTDVRPFPGSWSGQKHTCWKEVVRIKLDNGLVCFWCENLWTVQTLRPIKGSFGRLSHVIGVV